MRRIEQDVGGIARAEFQTVSALQFLALDTFAVDEGAMLAAEVLDERSPALPA